MRIPSGCVVAVLGDKETRAHYPVWLAHTVHDILLPPWHKLGGGTHSTSDSSGRASVEPLPTRRSKNEALDSKEKSDDSESDASEHEEESEASDCESDDERDPMVVVKWLDRYVSAKERRLWPQQHISFTRQRKKQKRGDHEMMDPRTLLDWIWVETSDDPIKTSSILLWDFPQASLKEQTSKNSRTHKKSTTYRLTEDFFSRIVSVCESREKESK